MSPGGWLESHNGDCYLVIDPDWSDQRIQKEWTAAGGMDEAPLDRTEFHRYSASQLRREQPDYDEFWGPDGELNQSVLVVSDG